MYTFVELIDLEKICFKLLWNKLLWLFKSLLSLYLLKFNKKINSVIKSYPSRSHEEVEDQLLSSCF